MRYIERILQPGERVLYTGTLHWVIYVPAFVLMAVAVVLLFAGGMVFPPAIAAAVLFALLALGSFFRAWFKRWTTEIDATDRRIVYKCGFIRRHTVEMNMDKVESVDVDQSVLGRMLNYGDITIRGTGETLEPLRHIGAPLAFRNYVTAR